MATDAAALREILVGLTGAAREASQSAP